jgi:hypothetical protein
MAKPKRRDLWIPVSFGIVAVAAFIGLNVAIRAAPNPARTTPPPHALLAAYQACGSKGVLTPQHDRLTMDTATGLDKTDIGCVLNQLAAPFGVTDQLQSTPVGAKGNDDWGSYQVTWIVEAGGNLNVTFMESNVTVRPTEAATNRGN